MKKIKEAEWADKGEWWQSWPYVCHLTVRAANCLSNAGVDPNDTRAVKKALREGRMKPGRQRGYGWKVHEYICRLMGVAVVRAAPVVWGCPHCGHRGKRDVFRVSKQQGVRL